MQCDLGIGRDFSVLGRLEELRYSRMVNDNGTDLEGISRGGRRNVWRSSGALDPTSRTGIVESLTGCKYRL